MHALRICEFTPRGKRNLNLILTSRDLDSKRRMEHHLFELKEYELFMMNEI